MEKQSSDKLLIHISVILSLKPLPRISLVCVWKYGNKLFWRGEIDWKT